MPQMGVSVHVLEQTRVCVHVLRMEHPSALAAIRRQLRWSHPSTLRDLTSIPPSSGGGASAFFLPPQPTPGCMPQQRI